MNDILDPVHGEFVGVRDAEEPIIESPVVQRLRRIHQLGLSFFVYPGATHTRFEHSVGVMHLAGRLAESIGLEEDAVQAYRLGGLLHDIGHSPYSHALEPIMEAELGFGHEERTCQLIDEIDAPFPVDREWVKDIVNGESEHDIVAGNVDVDRMDYLARDGAHTGLNHGNVDIRSIIQFATDHDGGVAFNEKATEALEGLFTARLHMTKSVYRHHTALILSQMLRRAVKTHLEAGAASVGEVMEWDDYQLHTHLFEADGDAGRLYRRIANRNPYKRALFRDENDLGRDGLRRLADEIDSLVETETAIAAEAGVDPASVLVDPPSPPTSTDYDVSIVTRGGGEMQLSDRSPLPDAVAAAEWRTTTLGVYAPPEHVIAVGDAAEDVLLSD